MHVERKSGGDAGLAGSWRPHTGGRRPYRWWGVRFPVGGCSLANAHTATPTIPGISIAFSPLRDDGVRGAASQHSAKETAR